MLNVFDYCSSRLYNCYMAKKFTFIKKNRKVVSLLFIGIFIIASAFSQHSILNDYITRTWSTIEGLPGNSVTDIIQAKDGYLYIGTYDGLTRFDGFDFTLFNKYSGDKYKYTSVRTLYEDKNGDLWVGSNDEGLALIKENETLYFNTENGLPNNSVRTITQDLNGNIWVGTAAGVCYITPEYEIKFPGLKDGDSEEERQFKQSLVFNVFCDTMGRIWMLTPEKGGLFMYDGSKFEKYKAYKEFTDVGVTSISQDSFGNFWVCTDLKGIYKFVDGKPRNIKTNTMLDEVPVRNICHASDGSTWFGCEKGVVLLREGVFLEFKKNVNSVNKIIEDREKNIWVGNDAAGLQKITIGRFSMVNLDSAVNAIAEDSDNSLWIGTDNGLLNYKNHNFYENDLTRYCGNNRIRHVALAKNGDILINTYREPGFIRASKIHGSNGKYKIRNWSTKEGLAGNKTRVAIESSNGEIYVGTTTGLSIIRKDGSVHNFTKEEGFDSQYIMALYKDNQGYIWIGTDGDGVYIMKDEKIVDKLNTTEGLAGNVIFKIIPDNKGAIWICTGTGLSYYSNSIHITERRGYDRKIFNFTGAQGLGADSIFQIIIDYTDNVWMVSNQGIFSVPYQNLMAVVADRSEYVEAKYYTQNDGLQSKGANSTALSARASNECLYFTMVDGFAIYNPLKSQAEAIEPILHIESFVLDNEEIKPNKDGEIVLPAGAKRLEISYTGLSYVSPEQLRFKYKLEGFDNKFSNPTRSRSITYTNLPAGKYIFTVTVKTGEGRWNQTVDKVAIIQNAFFYQKPIFWILCGLLLVFIVLSIFYIREQSNKRQRVILEQKVDERTKELKIERDKSEKLLLNILPGEIAKKLKDETNSHTIADYCEEATVLFADIVNFTKITSEESAEDIVQALNELFSRFDISAELMGVEKIKTIGDAYMAVCGLPTKNEKHALVMLRYAQAMYKDLEIYNREAKIKFQIRIGINTGPVIAGVIGKNKFIYDLWGDTVNTASRMESMCEPGKICMTENVKKAITRENIVDSIEEKVCDVKGKGVMHVYEI